MRRGLGARPGRPRPRVAGFLEAPEPLGYDFAQIFPDGAQSAGAGFLRMEPWRIRTQRVAALEPPHVWSAAASVAA